MFEHGEGRGTVDKAVTEVAARRMWVGRHGLVSEAARMGGCSFRIMCP